MKIGTWLLALVQPFIARILTALGFSLVTIVGMEVVIDQLKQAVISGVSSMPADAMNIFLLAGGGKALGMILGAIATKLVLWQIQSATRLLGVNPG